MKTDFTPQQQRILRKQGAFSQIASEIPSPRPRYPGATVSMHYVRDVIIGKVTRINATTDEIKLKARLFLDEIKDRTIDE